MPVRQIAKHALLAVAVIASLAGGPAEARRGGSFGSRGSRTYSAPSSTNLSPGYVAPVSRSMTDRSTAAAPQYAPSSSYRPDYAPQRRPGLFGGFGGGMLTGLLAGGLIGHFLGHGAGYGWGGSGGGGLLAILFQLALIGGGIWLVMRLFSRRSAAPSYTPDNVYPANFASAPAYGAAPPMTDLPISRADQAEFERLLIALQDAFSREDYAALRAVTTPEVMSYLAEELSDNATHGRRNEVTGTELIEAEVSEAWIEDGQDYATVALRYESVDIMRNRTTGIPLTGSAGTPTETTELWTFVRRSGGADGWKVSAIQEA